jgi:hypothetical protein
LLMLSPATTPAPAAGSPALSSAAVGAAPSAPPSPPSGVAGAGVGAGAGSGSAAAAGVVSPNVSGGSSALAIASRPDHPRVEVCKNKRGTDNDLPGADPMIPISITPHRICAHTTSLRASHTVPRRPQPPYTRARGVGGSGKTAEEAAVEAHGAACVEKADN